MKKYLIIGNAESVHLVKWVKELVKHFNVFVLSSKGLDEEIKILLPEKNITTLNLKLSESGGNYKLIFKYFRIKKIIRKIDPDFVNAHYVTSHGFVASLIKKSGKFRFKLIQSAWGTDILVTPFTHKLYYQITKFSLNNADLITSDSEHMSTIIRKMSFTPAMTFTFGLDKIPEIDLAKKDENLFYSNRMLSENYNIDEVITFFHRIYSSNPNARLIISHQGKQKQELENKSIHLGLKQVVEFIGFVTVSEQHTFYERAQFYISIPSSDSTSVSLIEAMAFGCVPVVSNIPANLEWITGNINGLIYEKNKTGFSDILKILNNKEQVIKQNRDLVKTKAFFPDSMKKYISKISNL